MMSLTIRKTILVPENYHDILEYYNKNKLQKMQTTDVLNLLLRKKETR